MGKPHQKKYFWVTSHFKLSSFIDITEATMRRTNSKWLQVKNYFKLQTIIFFLNGPINNREWLIIVICSGGGGVIPTLVVGLVKEIFISVLIACIQGNLKFSRKSIPLAWRKLCSKNENKINTGLYLQVHKGSVQGGYKILRY